MFTSIRNNHSLIDQSIVSKNLVAPLDCTLSNRHSATDEQIQHVSSYKSDIHSSLGVFSQSPSPPFLSASPPPCLSPSLPPFLPLPPSLPPSLSLSLSSPTYIASCEHELGSQENIISFFHHKKKTIKTIVTQTQFFFKLTSHF